MVESDFSISPLQWFVGEEHFFLSCFGVTKSSKSQFKLLTLETPERKRFSCYPRDTKWVTTTTRFALLISEQNF